MNVHRPIIESTVMFISPLAKELQCASLYCCAVKQDIRLTQLMQIMDEVANTIYIPSFTMHAD